MTGRKLLDVITPKAQESLWDRAVKGVSCRTPGRLHLLKLHDRLNSVHSTEEHGSSTSRGPWSDPPWPLPTTGAFSVG